MDVRRIQCQETELQRFAIPSYQNYLFLTFSALCLTLSNEAIMMRHCCGSEFTTSTRG